MKNIHSLTEQWEEILKMDIELEIQIYENLYGSLSKKKQKKLSKDQKISRYEVWENRVKGFIQPLEPKQLEELCRYLNSRIRDGSIYDSLFQTYLIPLFITLFVNFVVMEFIRVPQRIINNSPGFNITTRLLALLISGLMFLGVFRYITKIASGYKKDVHRKYFFEDVLSIVLKEMENRGLKSPFL